MNVLFRGVSSSECPKFTNICFSYSYYLHTLPFESVLYQNVFTNCSLVKTGCFGGSSKWLFYKWNFRSSHRGCSVRKGVLRNFTKVTGKHLSQSLFFNKVTGLRPATLLKKRLWHRCFPVDFVKFLRTSLLQNNSGWLLLKLWKIPFVSLVSPKLLSHLFQP